MSLTLDELRHKYLTFFANRGHSIIPSAPLVPDNDPTTLFTSSGMQPLVPYLLGQPHPSGRRLVDSQKSFRANDIEDVGDNRHTTFFEMLGNWSLGDYFKTEQLTWLWEFLTLELQLDPQRLYVTVYAGNEQLGVPRDDEAVEIWQQLFNRADVTAKVITNSETAGLQGGRIFFYPDKKNWWSRSGEPALMPVGEPGGPDSEVFYDFGSDLHLHEQSAWASEPCHVNCDCGRFMEIGNSVFMQYQKQTDGSFVELPQRNVDFGGGLERMLAAINGDPDVFLTDAFAPMIAALDDLTSHTYQTATDEVKQSYRVVVDHLKAAVMLAADGVMPSNKAQGYFVRRLVRRAIRHAQKLGVEQHIVGQMVEVVAHLYQQPYPQVAEHSVLIKQAFEQEEQKFHQALRTGMRELEKIAQLDEQTAFHLYETYGFPFELTQEIALERGVQLSLDKIAALRQSHADQSRTASAGMFKGGLADHSDQVVKFHTATHLLHAALRLVLGDSVSQKGSNITKDRLRFDFSFERALTQEELQQVQAQINDWIKADLPVHRQILPKDKALQSGAIAFFDNYPDEVSVYTIGVDPAGPKGDVVIGWISKELCGGPHVDHTGQIGHLSLTKEQSAGAGVRRVYGEVEN